MELSDKKTLTRANPARQGSREREGMKKRTHSDSVNMVTKQPVG